ncbi:MAG: nucleotidyltransferase family protein [Clostridia bacterium]|nr:nucleotidyltransferase family protein [Clostridia bacterium]
MDKKIPLLFELFRDALGTVSFPKEHLALLDEDTVRDLYTLAKKHDLAQIVADRLGEFGLLTQCDVSQKLLKQQLLAVYRSERLKAAYERISAVLDKAAIPYLPLKGTVIRPLYPQPYYRTSCDIDVLVKEESLEAAVSALSEAFPLEKEIERAYHDVSLYIKGGIHLELHFSILENLPTMDKVLARVWDYTLPATEGSFQRKMTSEFFLFHHITHAAYHFEKGGCGIRPLMDVFLILQKTEHAPETLDSFLQEAALADFYRHFTSLARVWFLNEPHTPVTEQMEAYLLEGGIYGSFENSVASASSKHRGKYLFKRIFPPYKNLANTYPSLTKCPILYPLFLVRRWFRVFNGKKRKRAVNEVKTSMAMTAEQKDGITALFGALGL